MTRQGATKQFWSPKNANGVPPDATLEDIWLLRHTGKTLDAQDAWLDWCARSGVRPGDSVRAQYQHLISNGMNTDQVCDALLLEVSFLRFRLETQKSDRRLAEVREIMDAEGVCQHFELFFQSALNRFQKGDYAAALDFFFRARRYARTPGEYHFAFFDIILCLENLGYDYSRQFDEFHASYDIVDGEWKAAIDPQYRALNARRAFSKGRIDELQRMADSGQTGGQLGYFLLWLSATPHLGFSLDEVRRNELLSSLVGQNGQYHSPYRARTLKFLLVNEDQKDGPRPSDRVERFYLWTWMWLTQPTAAGLNKLLQLKSTLPIKTDVLLTGEDHLLLENALRWLALLSGARDEHVDIALENVRHPAGQNAVPLDYERLVLDWLFARRDGNTAAATDTLTVIREHSFHASCIKGLASLVDGLELAADRIPPTLGELGQALSSICQQPASRLHHGVEVDLLARELKVMRDGACRETVRSVSMCALVRHLVKKSPASVSEVLLECFGYSSYDPFIHDPKLANFLARANRTLNPFVTVARKNGHVYGEFDSQRIQLKANNPHTTLLGSNDDVSTLFLPRRGDDVAAPVDEMVEIADETTSLPVGEWIGRQEIERLLGVSRATAVRQINSWIDGRLIQRRGDGKASRYKMSEQLRRRLLRDMEGTQR